MTKRIVFAGFVASVLCGAPAFAADVPVHKAPILSGYNWTGGYWGLNAGVGVSGMRYTSLEEDGTTGVFDPGFTGGLQFGYNWHAAPNWVFGLEGDIGYLGTNRSVTNFNDPTFFTRTKTDFYATGRARLGYAWDRSLFYVTGGVAFVHIKDSLNDVTGPNDPGSSSRTKAGLTGGGGLEVALHGNWTTKIEYLFINAGKINVTDSDDDEHGTYKHHFHVVKLGLNYRYGDPRVGPAAPMRASGPYNWTGFYIGANAGVGVGGTKFAADGFVGGNDLYDPGFTGGLTYGYNWQTAPNWVWGIESDLGYLGTKRSIQDFNDTGFNIAVKSDFYTTTRARLGYAWDRSLLYATGGVATVHIKDRFENFVATDVGSKSRHKVGWTIGGGLETAHAGNWTTKLEYLYIDPGTITATEPTAPQTATFDHQFHVVRLGMNYKFATGGR